GGRRRTEDGLGIPRVRGHGARDLRRDGGCDLGPELVSEDRAEKGYADRASDVAPELDLARNDSEESRVHRALRRVQIQRHADADTESDEDQVAHDFDLG